MSGRAANRFVYIERLRKGKIPQRYTVSVTAALSSSDVRDEHPEPTGPGGGHSRGIGSMEEVAILRGQSTANLVGVAV